MYEVKEREAKLELQAVMLNISGDNNTRLKEACRTLKEYAVYTDKIRLYAKRMPLTDAVDRAIDECIREGILEEFLRKHKAEAKEMSIFEYDQEKHMRQEREAAWEDGHAAGVEEGRAAGLEEGLTAGLEKGRAVGIKEGLQETARNLSEMGIPIETIAGAVKASVEEVQEWLNHSTNEEHH